MSVGFRVYGIPTPQGSKIPGVSKSGKAFVREQAGERLVSWREAVKEAAITARLDTVTMTGPIRLHIDFFMPRPASISVKKRPMPSVAPDLDKLVRAVGDALKAAGVYSDDSLVCSIKATKHYGDETVHGSPGAWIVVSEIITLQETQTL